MSFKTNQEIFWAGDFGNQYIKRNQSEQLLASNINLFSKALAHTSGIKSIIEFGANIGVNLKALSLLLPESDKYAVEINRNAAECLKNVIPEKNISNTSILDFSISREYDLSLVKGVLIHIDPNELSTVYEKLVNATSRYLLIAEYYNPTPVAIDYRGHKDKLFKRDFAGEVMLQHPEMKLVDYGFVYHKDPNFPQDDVTWFLLQKSL